MKIALSLNVGYFLGLLLQGVYAGVPSVPGLLIVGGLFGMNVYYLLKRS